MSSYEAIRRVARLSLVLAALAATSPLGAQGRIRELYCRGKAGLALKVDLDPSPRDTRDVVMVLEYARSTAVVRDSVRLIAPGSCTWNPYQHPAIPAEPGRVRFDVRREAQPWSLNTTRMMDTTVAAARFFPDPITLPRYLNDPRHYWKFYVDDATNLSNSFGSVYDDGLPTYVTIKGPVTLANDVRRDLVCRGGSAGLLFGGGTNAGDNLARVVLGYRVSPTVPGPAGLGLQAGTCAWTDRTAMPKEPGKIVFFTARNAQIKQAQSGSIDRSPTAAERYPDVFTIPKYLEDPQHYWTFTVMNKAPDSALTNGPWKRDLAGVLATGRTTSTPTTRSQPGTTSPGSQVYTPGAGSATVSLPTSSVGGVYQPGGAGSTSVVQTVYDIKNVIVSPTLDNLIIGFQAAPSIVPVVTVTPAAGGASVTIPVQGSAQGTMWRYVGSSKTPLARNTLYNYRIDAPASANARANSASGSFKTWGQAVTVAFTEIYLVSDGDADSNGELVFQAQTCPTYLLKPWELGRFIAAPMDWGDGKHTIDQKMTSYKDTVPDRFRVLVFGIEDDRVAGRAGGPSSSPYPYSFCSGNGPEPGANRDFDWNSVMIDFDLTKYPGAKGGEQFYRRSKALRNGATLMFEVRGYIQVTRQ
jgi:hypothetical protein